MLKRTELTVARTPPPDATRPSARATSGDGGDEIAGPVRLVPIEQRRTHYAGLRAGVACGGKLPGLESPLLVALRADDDYEVLDGFKRLALTSAERHDWSGHTGNCLSLATCSGFVECYLGFSPQC
ncbi:MAG: hypothetical protein JW751_00530 [Polyangiaceae bacterium]|nr:hypothetical protein [Polyangiaceae bacterium]